MKKFSKEYAEELAETMPINESLSWENHLSKHGAVWGYMKAIEETNTKELLEALIELKDFIEDNKDVLVGERFNQCVHISNKLISKAQKD